LQGNREVLSTSAHRVALLMIVLPRNTRPSANRTPAVRRAETDVCSRKNFRALDHVRGVVDECLAPSATCKPAVGKVSAGLCNRSANHTSAHMRTST
jgi:hypothetical protein